MSIKVKDIMEYMERFAPVYLKEDWDNVGLIIGDKDKKVERVLISLDAVDTVIDEAIDKNIDMIITHHPFIFKPIKKINRDTPLGNNIYKLIKNDISVYSAHTNLDIVYGGTNDLLFDLLGLNNKKILSNIYKKKDLEGLSEDYGMGRIGEFDKYIKLEDLCSILKNILNIKDLKLVGDKNNYIKKVAICTGSGMSFIKDAINNNVDVFITGDIKYHEAQDALSYGINLIDAGHFATENIIVDTIYDYLNKELDIDIIKSSIDINPFITI